MSLSSCPNPKVQTMAGNVAWGQKTPLIYEHLSWLLGREPSFPITAQPHWMRLKITIDREDYQEIRHGVAVDKDGSHIFQHAVRNVQHHRRARGVVLLPGRRMQPGGWLRRDHFHTNTLNYWRQHRYGNDCNRRPECCDVRRNCWYSWVHLQILEQVPSNSLALHITKLSVKEHSWKCWWRWCSFKYRQVVKLWSSGPKNGGFLAKYRGDPLRTCS
jgi:hypothetical protein